MNLYIVKRFRIRINNVINWDSINVDEFELDN
jgi:hypothetical protein